MTTRRAQFERIVGMVVAIVGGFIGSQTAGAQDSGAVNVDVAECINLKSPEERFACYEKRVGVTLQQGGTSPAPGNPAAAPAAQAVPPAVQAVPPAAQAPPPAAQAAAPAAQAAPPATQAAKPDIVATVTALRPTVPNSYQITLDNGQVWRQTESKWYPLHVGHKVRLSPTHWGADYRLSVEELKGFIQVERVR